jgi:hypothetical protein
VPRLPRASSVSTSDVFSHQKHPLWPTYRLYNSLDYIRTTVFGSENDRTALAHLSFNQPTFLAFVAFLSFLMFYTFTWKSVRSNASDSTVTSAPSDSTLPQTGATLSDAGTGAPQCCHCGYRGSHAPNCPFR